MEEKELLPSGQYLITLLRSKKDKTRTFRVENQNTEINQYWKQKLIKNQKYSALIIPKVDEGINYIVNIKELPTKKEEEVKK